jgi:hypothetical protein
MTPRIGRGQPRPGLSARPDRRVRDWRRDVLPETLRYVHCPRNTPRNTPLATDCGIYAYDAYVLQCARSLSHPLLTLDAHMRRVAAELKINIRDQAVS